ncbi:unnamed protein product, partial [Ectocarpus sp. 12 AP-2014]
PDLWRSGGRGSATANRCEGRPCPIQRSRCDAVWPGGGTGGPPRAQPTAGQQSRQRPRNPAPSRIRGGVRLPSPSRGGGNSLQGRLNWLDNGGPSASGTDRSSTARTPEGSANNNNNNNAGSKTKAGSVSATASRGGGRGGSHSSASGGRGRRGER